MPAGSASVPPPPTNNYGCQIIYLFRSCLDHDHVRAEMEHRLDGVLLEPGPQVRAAA